MRLSFTRCRRMSGSAPIRSKDKCNKARGRGLGSKPGYTKQNRIFGLPRHFRKHSRPKGRQQFYFKAYLQ
jgi:hypothetical protein